MHRGNVPPPRFSLLSSLNLRAGKTTELTVTARKIKEIIDGRVDGSITGVIDEAPAPIDLTYFRHPIPPSPLDLHPQVPVFEVRAGHDFGSGLIEEFCDRNPICIIWDHRGARNRPQSVLPRSSRLCSSNDATESARAAEAEGLRDESR
ncbi:hypothetical protein PRIPAC_70664 [Pristionchus pacificus]|nr:hypothetical protein PRIPAC_70664 [Pristionchus pacificus]